MKSDLKFNHILFRSIICLSLFLIVGISYSQYLRVNSSSYVYPDPNCSTEPVEKMADGDLLELLLDGEQTNGYYHVKCKSYCQNGWIYRNKVRRFEEPIPSGEGSNLNCEDEDILNIPDGYYEGTENLSGVQLKAKLNEIIDDHLEFDYSHKTKTDVWDILKETDRDPGNPDHVILLYSGMTKLGELEYDTWEREHVWSQSHGDFGRKKGIGSDVHNLRPVHWKFNQQGKSNKDFDEGGERFLYEGKFYGCYETDSTWEPRDEVKGDIARMMFYMDVRYEGGDGYPDLELINHSNTSKKFKNEPVYGNLKALIRWHEEDPVDDLERHRNHVIYTKYQKNRNPFIDYPEFVIRIWP